MADIADSYCERCGTRFTFETEKPSTLSGRARFLASAARHFVLNDGASLGDAVRAARNERESTAATLYADEFHAAFNFCMTCRRYTCKDCWNEEAGACIGCSPSETAASEPGEPLGEVAAVSVTSPLPSIAVAFVPPDPELARTAAVAGVPTEAADVGAAIEPDVEAAATEPAAKGQAAPDLSGTEALPTEALATEALATELTATRLPVTEPSATELPATGPLATEQSAIVEPTPLIASAATPQAAPSEPTPPIQPAATDETIVSVASAATLEPAATAEPAPPSLPAPAVVPAPPREPVATFRPTPPDEPAASVEPSRPAQPPHAGLAAASQATAVEARRRGIAALSRMLRRRHESAGSMPQHARRVPAAPEAAATPASADEVESVPVYLRADDGPVGSRWPRVTPWAQRPTLRYSPIDWHPFERELAKRAAVRAAVSENAGSIAIEVSSPRPAPRVDEQPPALVEAIVDLTPRVAPPTEPRTGAGEPGFRSLRSRAARNRQPVRAGPDEDAPRAYGGPAAPAPGTGAGLLPRDAARPAAGPARRPWPAWPAIERQLASNSAGQPGSGARTRPCRNCDLAISVEARFCRRCGAAQDPDAVPAEPASLT